MCGEVSTYTDDKYEVYIKFFGFNKSYTNFSQANARDSAAIIGRKVHRKINLAKELYFASNTICFVDNTMTKRRFCQPFLIFQV